MAGAEPFGQVAIRMGFVTEAHVQAALDIQASMERTRKERRLIGMIMLETGMISTDQLIAILKYYDTIEQAEHRREKSEDSSAQAGKSSEAPTD